MAGHRRVPTEDYHDERVRSPQGDDRHIYGGAGSGQGNSSADYYGRQESSPLYRTDSEQSNGGYDTYHADGHSQSGDAGPSQSNSSLPLYSSRNGSRLANYRSRETLDSSHRSEAGQENNDRPPMPSIHAVDFQTGSRIQATAAGQPIDEAKDAGNSGFQNASSSSTPSSTLNSRRRVDFTAATKDGADLHPLSANADEKDSPKGYEYAGQNGGATEGGRPRFNRTNSEISVEDDTHYDDYDWEDDDELVKQLDERYEQEYKKQQKEESHRHKAVIRRFSPVHLTKLLLTTFLGNTILVLLIITPALVVQFAVKNRSDTDEHLYYVCENVQAWCYWIAFNFIARWVIHALVELIPRLVVTIVETVWGSESETFRGWVEMFQASKDVIKPLFFSGFFFGSFAITFNSIFHLRDSSDPSNSRAHYTYRLYQVVELLFFIALVYSVEKVLIRLISLRFHAVAFSDRIKDNVFALSTIDKLKDYKPRRKGNRSSTHGLGGMRSGAATPPFGNIGSPSAFHLGFGSGSSAPPTPGAGGGSNNQHGVWSRLPLPASFREGNQRDNNDIPLQVTPQHFKRASRREDGTSATNSPATPATPATAATPNGLAAEMVAETKRSKRSRLFGRDKDKDKPKASVKVTAQEIAMAAMVDPLKTLQNPTMVKNGLTLDFASAADGKRLAKDLFYAFRTDSTRNYLVTSDFYPAFSSTKEAEAAFKVFDKDGNGDVSRPEIRHTILAAYKERRFLARSLQDVSEAVSTLDRLFQVAGWFIIALIAFAVFEINIYSNLTTAYTIAIAISFIFKSAAQNLFDSVVFLFATHPFDSGDRIFLEGDTFVVKQLGLFSTLFTRWDGTETLIANSKLGQLFITNLRRSPPQFENSVWQVGWDTKLEQLDALEAKMNNWLQTDENRQFSPSTSIVLNKFDFTRSIEIFVGMAHRQNWQDWGGRWNRRTAFHAAVAHYMKEVGITYHNSIQPVTIFQDDLDATPIYDDDEDDIDDSRSPLSPAVGGGGEDQIPAPIPPPQPLLGFVPAEGSKANMRKRKGFSKRRNMQGMGA